MGQINKHYQRANTDIRLNLIFQYYMKEAIQPTVAVFSTPINSAPSLDSIWSIITFHMPVNSP